jgi:hypothetical protein
MNLRLTGVGITFLDALRECGRTVTKTAVNPAKPVKRRARLSGSGQELWHKVTSRGDLLPNLLTRVNFLHALLLEDE